MDAELLIALWVLWLSVWIACLTAALMWTFNRGEAFHPHCVELQRTHRLFQVVQAATECKRDCAVKSVSAFISPRGSSSDKYFTVIVCGMIYSLPPSLTHSLTHSLNHSLTHSLTHTLTHSVVNQSYTYIMISLTYFIINSSTRC
jgi:hypothetical protein